MWVKQKGFTIVELLIVIVVIAILAAITIVAYNGIQQRAYDTSVKSDLVAASKALELYKIDNGSYPNNFSQINGMKTAGNYLIRVSTGAYKANSSGNNFIYCYGITAESYALAALSSSGNAWYISDSSKTPSTYPGTWTGYLASTCSSPLGMSGTGAWGYTTGAWTSWVTTQ